MGLRGGGSGLATGVDLTALEAHELLRCECFWYAALADLRKRFGQAWNVAWGYVDPAEAFNAWFLELLNFDMHCAWPPSVPPPAAPRPQEPPVAGAVAVPATLQTWVLLKTPYPWPNHHQDLASARESVTAFAACLKRPSPQRAWPGAPADRVDAALAPVVAASFEAPEALVKAAQAACRSLVLEQLAGDLGDFAAAARALLDEVREDWSLRCSIQCGQLAAANVAGAGLAATLQVLPASKATSKIRVSLSGTLPAELEGKFPKVYDIHKARVEHLQGLHRRWCIEARREADEASFAARLWAMLTRYQALFGPHKQGAGWHMALTPAVFDQLAQDLGVSHELFASPLNATLPSYCSLFEDTDLPFGSKGSFFKFCRTTLATCGGAYECNPPFEERLFREAVAVLSQALLACREPAAVALVMPDWEHSAALQAALSSDMYRGHVCIRGDGHAYLNGRQHCCMPKHRLEDQREARGSYVIFLENPLGTERWAVTDDFLSRHAASWLHGCCVNLGS